MQYLANSKAEPIGETWPSMKLKLPVDPCALIKGRLDPSPVDAKFGPLVVVKLLLIGAYWTSLFKENPSPTTKNELGDLILWAL